MSYIFIIAIVALNTLLGTAIFLRNPGSLKHRLYAAFVASVSIWMVANYLENEPGLVGAESLSAFLKIDFAFAALFYYLWFRFVSVFVGSALETRAYRYVRWIQLAATAPMFIVPFIDNALVTHIRFTGEVITFETGPFWTYYATLINLYMAAGLIVLAWGEHRASLAKNAVLKKQISYVFVSSALSLAIALIINLPQAFYHIPLDVSRVGLYGMVFLVAFTGYAMVRARFFEMKAALARAVASVIVTVLAIALLAFVLFWIREWIFGIRADIRMLVAGIVIVVVASLLFEHLRGVIEKITDRIFFRGRYDAAEIQKKLARILIETIDLNDLGNQVSSTIRDEFRLSKVGLLLETNRGILWHASGFPGAFPPEIHPILVGPDSSSITVFDDLPDGQKKELLRAYDIAVAVPLRVKGGDIAILLLGHKLSGEPFTDEDIRFFEVFSAELAIGVQNAKSFDDLKQLSRELELRVSDRTKELEELQKSEVAKAQEVARLKDEFVFLAVHELRTPIAAIRGFLELTQDSQKRFPVKVQRNLDAITSASTHMNQLINDLLEIARTDSGKMKIDVSPHAFAPILESVLSEVTPLIDEKKIHLEKSIHDLPRVLCDADKLKEVIENLVSNAIKYNRIGGSIFVTAYHPSGEDRMIFEIRDTGYGISKDKQSRIFQKFYRAVSRETQAVIGTGLGLFITRVLIERMGGTLMFSSTEHEGSTFAFTLPTVSER